MKWNKVLTLLAGSALALSACGDSSSGASRETDSSSSGGDVSASSSSVSPKPAFDTENLLPNMNLGSKFGTDLWLSAGKDGLYSLWFVDPKNAETSYGTVVAHSDLSNGVLAFDTTSGYIFATNDSKGDSVLAWIRKGIGLEFSVKDSALWVKIDGAEPVEVKKATRQIDPDFLSKGDSLSGKVLEWSNGDSSLIYRFYKNGEYIREVSGEAFAFEAGYYDVHRQRLLTLPVYFAGSVSILNSYIAKIGAGSYELDNQVSKKTYNVSSMTVEYPEESLLSKNSWSAKSNDTLKWTLSFDALRYTIKGKTGMDDNTLKIQREGEWAVFGDNLILSVDKCMAKEKIQCPAVEYGRLSDLDKAKFVFDNSDDSSEYAAPENWTAIVEE